MPAYAYHCRNCDAPFEVTMGIDEAGTKKVTCPSCKSKKVQRVYTSFFAKTTRKS